MHWPPIAQLDSSHPSAASATWRRMVGAARMLLRCDARMRVSELFDGRDLLRQWRDPLSALDWMAENARQRTAKPARWIGFLNYDLGRLFEQLPARATDDLDLPLFCFSLHEEENKFVPRAPTRQLAASRELRCTFDRPAYEAAVARVIEYIRAGDVFQVNLSQRFTAGLTRQPDDIYARLVEHSPAAFGAFLDYGDFTLLSNSPELFLRVTPDRRIVTRPIKGTRPRSPGMEIELRDSRKDQAELAMIVDLERNDLGRVCEIGSVNVVEPRVIEAHPTVYQGVATIEGTLRENTTFVDVLRAMFPSGSVTGAPKIRAMQIIDELEPVRRGAYCGAIGYLASDGTIEFNVAIRTMTIKNAQVHIPGGGGIVADSHPAAEYEETMVKAKAMFTAIGSNA
jgi:anthranilate/para-aminobenzoate synthase component I